MKVVLTLCTPSKGLWDPNESLDHRLRTATAGRHSQTISRNSHCVLGVDTSGPEVPVGGQWGKKLVKSQMCVGALSPAPFLSAARQSWLFLMTDLTFHLG